MEIKCVLERVRVRERKKARERERERDEMRKCVSHTHTHFSHYICFEIFEFSLKAAASE
jgi:hypothetical protein